MMPAVRETEKRIIRRAVITVLILVLFLPAVSCAILKPSFTVKDFYAAVNAGDYNKAESYFTEEFRAGFMKDNEDMFVLIKEDITPGSVIDVRVESENIGSTSAEVIIKLAYKKNNGVESRKEKFILKKKQNTWKIDNVEKP